MPKEQWRNVSLDEQKRVFSSMNVCKLKTLIKTYKTKRVEIEKELLPTGFIPNKLFVTEKPFDDVLECGVEFLKKLKKDFYCDEGIKIEEDCIIPINEVDEYIFYLKHHIATMKWRIGLFYLIPALFGLSISYYFGWLNNPIDKSPLAISISLLVSVLIGVASRNKFDKHVSIYEELVILLEYRKVESSRH